ncbi:MAG: flagellar motor protein [Thiobacillaceae bacterium]
MDYGSLIALGLAVVAILGGQAIEGGHVTLFLQPAAFLIVGVGTLAAVLMQNPISLFMRGVKMGKWIFRPPEGNNRETSRKILVWANIVRQEGFLALERQLAGVRDPYLKSGLQLLVDGTAPDKLREALEVQITQFENHEYRASRIWEAAGGYSPTLGIIGAVMGLIHVMGSLSDPHKLGDGIAVAFVATIYGVGLANLVFLPIANKLKLIIAGRVSERELILDGLVGIANGDNPRIIEQRLSAYL